MIRSYPVLAMSLHRTDTVHALAIDLPEHKETWCGRNATEWNFIRNEGMTEGEFIQSSYSCQRCIWIMTK